MLDEHLYYRGMVVLRMTGERRQQSLLLRPEVLAALAVPELHERGSGLAGAGAVSPLELERDVETLVVLTRQGS